MIKKVKSPQKIDITITPPGDKSISHRAALLNSFAYGTAHVSNFCVGDDRTSMLGCLKGLVKPKNASRLEATALKD